jgi:hypothetical protein
MPRESRDDRASQVDHALNRGNQRLVIFHKPEDYKCNLWWHPTPNDGFDSVRISSKMRSEQGNNH